MNGILRAMAMSISVFLATFTVVPPASANSFGGYTFSVGQGITGERVSILAPGSMVIASGNFVLFRTVQIGRAHV